MASARVGVLRHFSDLYEVFGDLANLEGLGDEAVARCVEAAAHFASDFHPGRLSDGYIENRAVRIGHRLGLPGARGQKKSKRRVLHVSPYLWHAGGHTRTLLNWIRLDDSSEHSIALTEFADSALKNAALQALQVSGGHLTVLSRELSVIERARQLRRAAVEFDVVVLHHTCNDVVPVIALACDDLPPTAFVNDCDHAFWLGGSVADLIVNQRQVGRSTMIRRQLDRECVVLPIPLQPLPAASSNRAMARERLSLEPGAKVLVSVGRSLKFRPSTSHHFLRTVSDVLDAVPDAHFLAVGITEDDARQFGCSDWHPRIRFCGSQPNPHLFVAAADLYLETMPFGSATAVLEACLAGVPVVLPFAPPHELFVTNHGLDSILKNPHSERQYVTEVLELLSNCAARYDLGLRLRGHVMRHHTGCGWRQSVRDVYAACSIIRHSVREIPRTPSESSALDMAIVDWRCHDDQTDVMEASSETVRSALLATSHYARQGFDYRAATALLKAYLTTFGLDRRVARAAAAVTLERFKSLGRSWPVR